MIYRLLLYLQLLYFQKLETNVIIKIIARIIKSEKGSRLSLFFYLAEYIHR